MERKHREETMGKGICSVCDESHELSEEGFLLKHTDDRHGKICTGVGRPATTSSPELPGPRDWGYKYDPSHQRDPHDNSKPLPR